MSNVVDFMQADEKGLVVPAGRPMVYLDGVLAEELEVVEICRGDQSEHSWASFNCGVLDAVNRCKMDTVCGKHVRVVEVYDGGVGKSKPFEMTIFYGRIDSVQTKLSGSECFIELVAKDFSSMLDRISVYGRRVSCGGNDGVYMPSMQCVFNADGKGNRARVKGRANGKNYTVFEGDLGAAVSWTCAEAVDYLLNEHLVCGMLEVPDFEILAAMMGCEVLDELDVNGDSLLKAIERCCKQAGVKFRFEACDVNSQANERIVFYRSGQGRCVELDCQRAGEELSVSRSQIVGMSSYEQSWPETRVYVGMGGFKRYEATFELIAGWAKSLEGRSYEEYSVDSSSFVQLKDVYRKWCLDEAGSYSGQAYDFSKIFDTDMYLPIRRCFHESLSVDEAGGSVGYFVEVSVDGGASWQSYSDNFDVFADECGVWFGADEVGMQTWQAINAGSYRVRVTASVESDERLRCEFADGPVNSVAETVEHVVVMDRFECRKVTGKSIFYGQRDKANQVDDSSTMLGYLRQLAMLDEDAIEVIGVTTPIVLSGYQPGDRVIGGGKSDVIGIGCDGQSLYWVESVKMDFMNQQTELKVLRRRQY
jgi:hypothetical protein